MKEDIPVITTPCWTWPRPNTPNGYFVIVVAGQRRMLHRLIYEIAVGPIPDGLTIDHLCRNTLCIRPDHLEPVTIATNIMRGVNPAALRARQTVCTKGLHELSGDNLMIEYDKKGRSHRRCKPCRYSRQWVLPRESGTPMLPRRPSYPSKNKDKAKRSSVSVGGKP